MKWLLALLLVVNRPTQITSDTVHLVWNYADARDDITFMVYRSTDQKIWVPTVETADLQIEIMQSRTRVWWAVRAVRGDELSDFSNYAVQLPTERPPKKSSLQNSPGAPLLQ